MSQYVGSISVDTGIRRVKVNEEGEFIQFSVNDSTFFDRFSEFLLWMEMKEKELDEFGRDYNCRVSDRIQKETVGMSEEEAEEAAKLNNSEINELVKKRTETYKECCVRLDMIFGEGCCRKVFGDIVPDDMLIGDFVEQITPILEQLGRERNEKLRLKYNRNRKGANSPVRALPGGHV